jgi:hypothetical protein
MILQPKKFMALVKRECGTFGFFAWEIGEPKELMYLRIITGQPLNYEISKKIITMFGATAMITVIDWEGMNVRCPI